MPQFSPKFKATGIGTLPLADPEEAIGLIRRALPEIPFWPQLSARGPWEDMIVQSAPGLPWMKADLEGRRVVIDAEADKIEALTGFYEADMAGELDRFGSDREVSPGYFALIESVTSEPGAVERFKGHVTGPVTFMMSVKDEAGQDIIHDPELKEALARGLGLKGGWQAKGFPKGFAQPIIFIDEPALTGFGSAFMSLERAEAMNLLNATIEPIHQAQALAGIHVCGNSDWSMILATEIDIVNFDAFEFGPGFCLYPKEIGKFLERGGVIAWGLIPTVKYTGEETAEGLIGHLNGLIDELAGHGLDRGLIEDRSLITPACGLGSLKKDQALGILDLLSETSAKLRA